MKSTNQLMDELNNSSDVSSFIRTNNESLDKVGFYEYLELMVQQSGMKKAEIIKKSQLNEVYTYQVFSGKKNPSKDKICALALAMKLDLDKTQRLLKLAGDSVLYPKNSRDCIIISALNKGLTVMETNRILYENSMECLH
ncbi:MAG: hypothetical protein ACI4JA_07090 [Oscillospiraceae bacterium]